MFRGAVFSWTQCRRTLQSVKMQTHAKSNHCVNAGDIAQRVISTTLVLILTVKQYDKTYSFLGVGRLSWLCVLLGSNPGWDTKIKERIHHLILCSSTWLCCCFGVY